MRLQTYCLSIAAGAGDADGWKLIVLLGTIDTVWDTLDAPNQEKAVQFISNVNLDALREQVAEAPSEVIRCGLNVDSLKRISAGRIKHLEAREVEPLLVDAGAIEAVVCEFESGSRYKRFVGLRKHALDRLAKYASDPQYGRLIGSLSSNGSLRRYFGWLSLAQELFVASRDRATEAESEWKSLYEIICEPDYRHPRSLSEKQFAHSTN